MADRRIRPRLASANRATRLTAVDAQFYWMAAKVASDQFLLYGFAGEPVDLQCAIDEVLRRARGCPDLTIRVDDAAGCGYPRWVPGVVGPDRVLVHQLSDGSWAGCLDAVAGLAEEQLDAGQTPWRLHVFMPVRGIPGGSGAGAVVVLQVGHALADGARASDLAAWLLGRDAPVAAVRRESAGWLPWRAAQAARGHRRLVRDIRLGLLGPPAGLRLPLASNARPAGARAIRTLVRRRAQLSGPTVTVAVLAAVSKALAELLDGPTDALGAEVPMAKPGVRLAHNHFGNVTVGLYSQLAVQDRMRRIAADLANGRRRFEHPATRLADRAFAAVPAPVLRWGVGRFDAEARPALVAGNTVLSSVYRGANDLSFGGAPVLLTAGYPALSAAMGLTHGVHGIGDTIAISVHAAASAVEDIDDYLRLLDAAL